MIEIITCNVIINVTSVVLRGFMLNVSVGDLLIVVHVFNVAQVEILKIKMFLVTK